MLENDPGWQEFKAQLREVEDDRRRHDEEMQAVIRAHADAVAEWEGAKSRAVASGGVAPPHPADPDLSRFDQLGLGFRQRIDTIRREQSRYLLAEAERFEAQAADEAAELIRKAQAPLGRLRKTAADLSALLVDVRRVRHEIDRRDPNRRPSRGNGVLDRTRQHVGLVDLVALLDAGADPLAVGPLPGRPETEPRIDRDVDPFAERRDLGLRSQEPRPFGDPEAPDPDRANATKRTTVQQGIRYRRR